MNEDGLKVVGQPDKLDLLDTDTLIAALRKRFPDCFILYAEWIDKDGKHYRICNEGVDTRLLGASERIYRHYLRETDESW